MGKRKQKNGMVRTVEMLITVLLTFIFILFISANILVTDGNRHDLNVADLLQKNLDFRNCVIIEDQECLNRIVKSYLNPMFAFSISISKDKDFVLNNLPQSKIDVESLFLHGNITSSDNKIIKIYIYEK